MKARVRSGWLFVVLAVGCAPPATPSMNIAPAGSTPAPVASKPPELATSHAKQLPAPPPGCRPLTARVMPHPSFVQPAMRSGTFAMVAADRLVIFQSSDGVRERGEMFDPATDTWTTISPDGAPRYGTFKEGHGPLGSPTYFAFEDWVVILWFDGNHSPRFAGAVFDARHNTWHAMSTTGMPAQLSPAIELGTAGNYVRLHQGGGGGDRYDVRADRWSALPSTRGGAAPLTAAVGTKIVVWSGTLGEAPASGAIFDLATNQWKPMSTDQAPSARYVAWSARAGQTVATWSGNAVQGRPASLRDGGIYDVTADRWTPIPAANAPDPLGGVFDIYLAWTGEALLYRELSNVGDNGSPRRLAFFDPTLKDWWRTSFSSHARSIVLGFGRVLVLDAVAPRIVHPREKLECPVVLGTLPVFDKFQPGSQLVATVRIGDEVVVWGRLDNSSFPACPPGAPCIPAQSVVTPINEGAVLSP